MWGAFRIGNRGKIENIERIDNTISSIYKYKNYSHKRTIQLIDEEIQIIDELISKGEHEYKFYMHFAPDFEFDINGNILNSKIGIKFIFPSHNVKRSKTPYFPEMFVAQKKSTIILSENFTDSICLKTTIQFERDNKDE